MRSSGVCLTAWQILTVGALAVAEPGLRHPVALAVNPAANTAYVANERAGTVSVIGLSEKRVIREVSLAGRPVDVALLHDGGHAVVADARAHALHFFKVHDGKLTSGFQIPCSSEPTRLAVARFNHTVAVSSTWGRRVEIHRADPEKFPAINRQRILHLDFAPREMLFFSGGRQLLIADAFGGRYAIYDAEKGRQVSNRRIPAHNIRGLALDPGGTDIVFSHQILNPIARTTFNDVHWGVLMANVARSIPIANLTAPHGDILRNSVLHRLGTTGMAAGDPGAIALQSSRVVIALSGVSAVEVGSNFSDLKRVDTGLRPTVLQAAGDKAYVVNTFSDSISVIDLKQRKLEGNIQLGEQRELTAAEKGERIFFDARRSHNGWLSCHSCHTDGHSNGQLNDNLGDGSFGAPKRVLSLLGVGKTGPWAWNGSIGQLEEQIHKSITSTMQGRGLSEEETAQLKAFLLTLRLPPSRQIGDRLEPESVARGSKLFARMDCVRCHKSPSYTSTDVYDVGLRDELGREEFNPPSLRGLAYRARFFHDNRAESLVELFYEHRHQLKEELTPGEILDLSQFLRSL